MTVHAVQECVVPYYFKPKKGNVKPGVEVSIRAHASAVPVNPFYASLADDEGYYYTSTLGGCVPEFTSTSLHDGELVRAFITFEVPTSAKGLHMRYRPVMPGSEQSLEFDLGR